MELDRVTVEDFAPFVGQQFVLPAQDAVLVLEAATPLPPNPPRAPRPNPFTLDFTGPAPLLPQATYAFSHPDLGDFDLFIVPVGPTAEGGYSYQALFN